MYIKSNALPQYQNNELEVDKKLADTGTEMAIVACLMQEPAKMIEAQDTQLDVDHFTSDTNKYLYGVMVDIFREKNGKDCTYDIAALMLRAKQKGIDEEFNVKTGEKYIAYLTITKEKHVDLGSFKDYVNRIIELSIKRRMYTESLLIQEAILTSSEKSEEILVKAQNDFNEILMSSSNSLGSFQNLGDSASGFIAEAMREQKKILGIPTGFPILDSTIEGLKRGNLLILSAPKKTGKSAFLMNIGLNVATGKNTDLNGNGRKIPVLMISTEMSDAEILARSLANISFINEKDILKGNIGSANEGSLKTAENLLKASYFYHMEMRYFTLEKIIATTRRFVNNVVGFKEDGSAKDCLIIFDYIKMPAIGVSASQEQKEYKMLGAIANGLKELAGDLNIPILTACQTNRSGDVANSYELTWFCNTFLALTKNTPQTMAKYAGLGKSYGNQNLKITANRGGDENYTGICFDFMGQVLKYEECGDQIMNDEA